MAARSTYTLVAIVPGAVGRVEIDVRSWRSVPLMVAEAAGTVPPLAEAARIAQALATCR